MKTVTVEIPEGKRAEWVNGVLTLVDEHKKCHEFEVGNKAVLNKEAYFLQVSGDYALVNTGAEVEIIKVYYREGTTEKIYQIKHQNSTCTMLGRYLDKIEYKFNVGDLVTFKDGKKSCTYTITDRFIAGKDCRAYKLDDCENVEEDKIELYVPRDITERIKTFEDAVEWCVTNGKQDVTELYNSIDYNFINSDGEILYEECKVLLAYLKARIITAALNEGWEPTFEDEEERWYVGYNKIDDIHVYENSYYCAVAPKGLIFKSGRIANYASSRFEDIYRDFYGCRTATGYFKPLGGDFQKVIDDNFWKLATDK